MPGYDQHVYEGVCKQFGHTISRIFKSVARLKDSGFDVIEESACSKCGMNLDEVRSMKIKKSRGPNKAKEASQETVA